MTGVATPPRAATTGGPAPAEALAELTAGRLRAAEPDPSAPDGWRVNPDVKAAILAAFADRTSATWEAGPLAFRDRAAFPPIDPGPDRRVVPGGTAIRTGAHLEPAGGRRRGHERHERIERVGVLARQLATAGKGRAAGRRDRPPSPSR